MRNNKVRAIRLFVRFVPLATCLTVAATAQIRTIETTQTTLHLSEATGDLVGLRWKDPNLEVIGEPRLGENFRLLMPEIGYQAAYFNSRDQHLSRFETIPDGVICVYDSLQNDRETSAIKVRYQIRAVNHQILFSIEVENPTGRKLAEVMYGIIGGQLGIDNRLDTESLVPGENTNLAPHLFRQFQSGGYGGGNLGIRYDANGFLYPGNMTMGWMNVFNPRAKIGYYYANQDPELRLSALYLELRPF